MIKIKYILIILILSIPLDIYSYDKESYNSYLEAGKKFYFEAQETNIRSMFPEIDGELIKANPTKYDDKVDAQKRELFDSAQVNLIKANAIFPDNQESHYFLGETYDKSRLVGFIDFIDEIKSNYVPLATTIKISEQFELSIKGNKKYKGEIAYMGPRSKITAIWSILAFNYYTKGNLDSARYAFEEGKKRGGFPDILLEHCRNILNSCDTNAILLTNGDNDTFPMWYLQENESFRKDITILNLTLANFRDYLKIYKHNPPFGGKKIPFSFPDDILYEKGYESEKDELDYDFISTSNPKDLTIEIFMFKNILTGKDSLINLTLDASPQFGGDYDVLLTSDKVVIDILKQTKFTRPLYYSETVASSDILFSNYLKCEGFASRVVPFEVDNTEEGLYDKTIMNKLLLNPIDTKLMPNSPIHTFSYEALKKYDGKFKEDYILSHYRNVYLDYLFQASNIIEELNRYFEVLERITSSSPFYPPLESFHHYYYSKIYNSVGEYDKSREYSFKGLDQFIMEKESEDNVEMYLNNDDIKLFLFLLQYIDKPSDLAKYKERFKRLFERAKIKINENYHSEIDMIIQIVKKDQPLIRAVMDGNLQYTKHLINLGADINTKDYYERNALNVAEQEGHTEIVKYLKSVGAKNILKTK